MSKWQLVPHDNYMSEDCGTGEPPIQILDENGDTVACNTTFYPTALRASHAATIVAAVNGQGELLDTLRDAQKALALIIEPDAIKQSTVIAAFAQCMAAEAKARAAIVAHGGVS